MGKTMILKRIFARKPEQWRPLYEAIVAAARQPKFYVEFAVADTVDGRFDMIALHLFLVLDRLRGEAATEDFRQQLTDGFFADMDMNLREMGVGDLSVGKKVRKMAEAFYGRVTAYASSLEKEDASLCDAIARNVYADATSAHAPALANWTRQAKAALAVQPIAGIIEGKAHFP